MTGPVLTAPTDISMISTECTLTQMLLPLRPMVLEKRRELLCSPLALSLATARPVEKTRCRERMSNRRTHPEVTSSTTSAIFAIMFKIWALMCIKTTVPARMVRGLARTAAAIHGCCKVSRQLPAPAMDTVRILAPAVRPRAKPFTPAAIVTVMEAGNSIRPASTGAQALAGTAVRRTMTTLRTA